MTARPGIVVSILLAALGATAGCSGSSQAPVAPPTAAGQNATADGVVSGTLAVYGGAFHAVHHTGCGCELAPGTVRFIRSAGRRIDVAVGKSGRFTVRLPVGRYSVKAGLTAPFDWPMGSCNALEGPYARFDRRADSYYFDVGAGQHLRVGVGCMAL